MSRAKTKDHRLPAELAVRRKSEIDLRRQNILKLMSPVVVPSFSGVFDSGRLIIVAGLHGRWPARFEGSPEIAFVVAHDPAGDQSACPRCDSIVIANEAYKRTLD